VIEIERRIGQGPQKRVDRFEQLDALVQQLPAEEDLGVCEDMQYQPFRRHHERMRLWFALTEPETVRSK
jgi:hypothetical protein